MNMEYKVITLTREMERGHGIEYGGTTIDWHNDEDLSTYLEDGFAIQSVSTLSTKEFTISITIVLVRPRELRSEMM